ncbi:transcriptional regulator [Empedobacter sp. UBA5987]|uniref:transcriptional regulator n=1 Tax=Empedobacter sp. UBA5987 TaxID=1946444 RepID=UPI0025B7BBBA|nr:transcriptional regulator [Empedobacter sp. UBA5987]
MNYIKQLNSFYNKIQNDPQIAPCQIALYNALYQCWNKQRFADSITIIRDEIMRLSKITSKSTYHRSMKLLHNNGYIIYEPSYNSYVGSKVHIIDLTKTSEKQKNTQSKNGQAIGTPMKRGSSRNDKPMETPIKTPIEPLYKHINNKTINNSNCLYTQAEIFMKKNKKIQSKNEVNQDGLVKVEMTQKEKSSAKKEKGIIPTLEEAKSYFLEKGKSTIEAEKFFYYFESIGWLVGGKTKMKNWKAAANNWFINSVEFSKAKNYAAQKPLDTSPNKRYDEPL